MPSINDKYFISAYLSTLHLRLFTSLIFIEPHIHDGIDRDYILLMYRAMGMRRETWPTRAKAEKPIRKNPFYPNWNNRAIDRLIKYSLLDVSELCPYQIASTSPTPRREDNKLGNHLRTTSPKDMEAALLGRLNLSGVGRPSQSSERPDERDRIPDLDPSAKDVYPPYRPESTAICKLLPSLRPSVLWICSAKLPSLLPDVLQRWLNSTGTGVGGSGGERAGRVELHVIEGDCHAMPMDDKLGEVFAVARAWLVKEMTP